MSSESGYKCISAETIRYAHQRALSVTPKEPFGILHPDRIEGLAQSPARYRYYEQTEDIFVLAAYLYIKIAKAHVFQQANKRTAFLSAKIFLYINGFDFTSPLDVAVDIAVRVATNEPDYNDPKILSSWLKEFSAELSLKQLQEENNWAIAIDAYTEDCKRIQTEDNVTSQQGER